MKIGYFFCKSGVFIVDIHCCDKSNNIKCREACKRVLKTKNTIEEILDGLHMGGCGVPNPQVI